MEKRGERRGVNSKDRDGEQNRQLRQEKEKVYMVATLQQSH